MDLRHLRYFVAVAEELHFTRAAARIGIAQPPLTMQIKALEAELGVVLFDRSPGKVRLTAPGSVLLSEARDILARVGAASLRCQLSAKGMLGRIGVGFTESAAFRREVTESLNTYRRLYPEVEMTLVEDRSVGLVQSVRQGRIDLAFVRLPIGSDDGVKFVPLSSERMVVALPKDHALSRRKSVRLIDLAQEPFVLYPRSTRLGISDMIVSACEQRGFSPRVIQLAPQISSTINLVASGLGLTIVPACMQTCRAHDVRYLYLNEPDLKASFGIALRRGPVPPAIANMIALTS
jgi:DNA-binding transcriptional LysR family regulator